MHTYIYTYIVDSDAVLRRHLEELEVSLGGQRLPVLLGYLPLGVQIALVASQHDSDLLISAWGTLDGPGELQVASRTATERQTRVEGTRPCGYLFQGGCSGVVRTKQEFPKVNNIVVK